MIYTPAGAHIHTSNPHAYVYDTCTRDTYISRYTYKPVYIIGASQYLFE